MVQRARQGMMATWPSRPTRRRPHSARNGASPRALAPAHRNHRPPPRRVRLRRRPAPRRHDAAPDAPALHRVRRPLGICRLPRQPRRLRQVRPAHRPAVRHPPGSPRLRLRPLPGRRYRLARPAIPDELTGATTSPVAKTTGAEIWGSRTRPLNGESAATVIMSVGQRSAEPHNPRLAQSCCNG
jgi:hypothetical protein